MDSLSIVLLIAIGLLIIWLAFDSLILNEINKTFKVPKTTYKRCFSILLATTFFYIAVGVGSLFVPSLFLGAALLLLVGPFIIAGLLYKKFFGVGWLKSILIWLLSTLVTNILFLLAMAPFQSYFVELLDELRAGQATPSSINSGVEE